MIRVALAKPPVLRVGVLLLLGKGPAAPGNIIGQLLPCIGKGIALGFLQALPGMKRVSVLFGRINRLLPSGRGLEKTGGYIT